MICHALGSKVSSTHRSLLVTQYPKVDVVNPATREVVEKARQNDVPNQVVFDAVLESGVVPTYKLHNSATIPPRAGPPPKSYKPQPPVPDWRIFGSKAEIRITGYRTWSINTGSDDFKVKLWRVEDDEEVGVDIGLDEFEHLSIAARNIGRLYEAFAEKEWYPDFEHALKTHELIEGMYRENGF